jgi:hypothetical protein
MGHVHVHAPHELTDGSAHGDAARPQRVERRLELVAVMILAVTTVATAWSGYQAARWSGEQSESFAQASAARVKAGQQTTQAGQLRIDDLIGFEGWLQARQAGDRDLATLYERRFRPEFRPAFEAWLAQRPFSRPPPIPGPQYMPEYRPAADARAAAFDRDADARFKAGTEAKSNDDRYILSTVFFAAVLFFAGISLRLDWRPLRLAVLAMAGALLLGGIVFVVSLPTA